MPQWQRWTSSQPGPERSRCPPKPGQRRRQRPFSGEKTLLNSGLRLSGSCTSEVQEPCPGLMALAGYKKLTVGATTRGSAGDSRDWARQGPLSPSVRRAAPLNVRVVKLSCAGTSATSRIRGGEPAGHVLDEAKRP